MDNQQWMTFREAADYLRVSIATMRRYRKKSGLPVHRISNNNVMVNREELEQWLKSF